jgi:probable lipoprotein NlpC
MKILFFICLIFFAVFVFAAAPLEGRLTFTSKTPYENTQVYIDARNNVINAAIKYINTPYRYGGMTSRGLDCSGFICLSFNDALGVNLPRSASGLYSWVENVSFEKAQPGDLLFFKTDASGNITHVALYLGGREFIHSASEGKNTGVIFSTLDEQYWARSYAGAGRAFPEAPSAVYPGNVKKDNRKFIVKDSSGSHIYLSASLAPTWNSFLKKGDLFRGFSSNLGVGINTGLLNTQMSIGLEIRPEYDRTLGVFRLPLTLSWGFNERIRIFGGPAFSFGDASVMTESGIRYYSGGTSWFGALGITVAPVIIKTSHGNFSPYLEAAWQNYRCNDSVKNLNADISTSLRLSTGIRYKKQLGG